MAKITSITFVNLIGIVTAVAHFFLWVILVFANPYVRSIEIDVIAITFVAMVLPALLAIISVRLHRPFMMYLAFLWSLPMSFYFTLTEGIFRWFGVISLFYLTSAILMSTQKRISVK